MPQAKRLCILVVDDEASNLDVMRELLREDYRLLFAKNGAKAIEIAVSQQPNLILLDVVMPEMGGIETCESLKRDPLTAAIPVIFISAAAEVGDEARGFAAGAVDYIAKPVSPAIVRARVATHLSLVRVEELQRSRLQIVRRLGRAAEYRDNQTGLHVIRMSHYARVLALAAGWTETAADELLQASPMHDVGKIGIPDTVLLKPGPLNEADWHIMRRHPWIGAQIIGDDPSSLLTLAREIALAHHERWDGSGYPSGLKGDLIPQAGRIVAIADVFDALTTARPYKPAWRVEVAVDYLRDHVERHFDPLLVPLFLERMDHISRIKERWAEEQQAPALADQDP